MNLTYKELKEVSEEDGDDTAYIDKLEEKGKALQKAAQEYADVAGDDDSKWVYGAAAEMEFLSLFDKMFKDTYKPEEFLQRFQFSQNAATPLLVVRDGGMYYTDETLGLLDMFSMVEENVALAVSQFVNIIKGLRAKGVDEATLQFLTQGMLKDIAATVLVVPKG